MAAVLFALDRAGQGNGAAVEQEFSVKVVLPRIRVEIIAKVRLRLISFCIAGVKAKGDSSIRC